jgi:hypothetical protein
MRVCGGILLCSIVAFSAFGADDVASVKGMFTQPPREYSTVPFWVWNDMMSEAGITATLDDLASQGVHQVIVHPRPGLMTPYLSKEWFRLWKFALDEGKKHDMNVWIYDENSYPSGFAGGNVPEAMPESRGLGLFIQKSKLPGPADNSLLAVLEQKGDKLKDVTEDVKAGKDLKEGDYYVATIKESKTSDWFGGKNYVDLLHPGVTQKFLEITLDAYAREIGDEFGKHVTATFTDEPHLAPAGGLHWTTDLPEVFQKRWGYSLLENLPGLIEETGDWKRVRHDYFETLLELFIERWAMPYSEYCEKHNFEFTGHYWEHEWPNTGSDPDNMAMYPWSQRPSIDILFNQYDEGPHSQFGNVRAVKELASSANQIGRARTLCETYGGSGWDMRFEDLKRIGDWVSVLGVNTINEHLSHSTLRGARKRDYPIVFSYHACWWEAYHIMESYFTRVSCALSNGKEVNDLLIVEPTSTAWMYQATQKEHRDEIGESFQKLVTDCAKGQIEFDLGAEDTMGRFGSVDGASLVVGERRYNMVVLPAFVENLNEKTWGLLETYAKNGGAIVSLGSEAPSLIDGQTTDRGKNLASAPGWKVVAADAVVPALQSIPVNGAKVSRADNDAGILYHQRRKYDDGDVVFLVNTSIDKPTSGSISSRAKSVEKWDLEDGSIEPYAWADAPDGLKVDFTLPPCGSLMLHLSDKAGEKGSPESSSDGVAVPGDSIKIKRLDPNVLILDFVDLSLAGETKEGILFKRAEDLVFQKNGFNKDPWDASVQFRDELIKKTFPPDSGFEATYKFTIEGQVPKELNIVVERPDIYTVTCNDKPLSWDGKSWWLDRAFGKMDIHSLAIVGENKVTIKASPLTMFHEIEPAYLLGDFGVKLADKGFVVIPEQALNLGSWKEQGLDLYGARVSYASDFKIDDLSGRYFIKLPEWYGSIAKVLVNGKEAGYIYRKPAELDVTKLIEKGENSIEVIVFGTPKNTLGPHHGNPPLGIASPGAFSEVEDPGPPAGAAYSTIGYGLFSPFELVNAK